LIIFIFLQREVASGLMTTIASQNILSIYFKLCYSTKISDHSLKTQNFLACRLKLKKMEDWYKITTKDFVSNSGSFLLKSIYKNSPSKAVMSAFPSHKWLIWKFSSVPNGFWKNRENQLAYTTYLGEILGYKSMDDWYNVRRVDFQNNCGASLLAMHHNSPAEAIQNIFTEHKWLSFLFKSRAPRGIWRDKDNHKQFLEYVGEQLGY
jgi:hypothetical protein